ncbi:hypothetical protein FBU30_010657 [Linnemannia zychae]|nr:hypothetical protein FBU30_010657 [Linnemannia zychae]
MNPNLHSPTPKTPSQHQYSVRQLRSIVSRLDLLKAGSLLLLPSVLPYLASALTALTISISTSSSPSTSDWKHLDIMALDGEGKEQVYLWWTIPLLPCMGLVLPMVLAKIWDTRRGLKMGKGGCCRMKRQEITEDMTTATNCPYARLLTRLGFKGCSSSTQPEDSGLLLPTEAPSNDTTLSKQQPMLNPRTLLLTSLCLWSVLLAFAPRLGLNKSVSFSVYSLDNTAVSSPSLSSSSPPCASAVSPFFGDAITTIHSNDNSEEQSSDETSMAWVDISKPTMDARVAAAEDDEVMDSEWRFPQQILESITIEQHESLSALRDFWDALEQVVGDPQETNEMGEEFEGQLDEPLESFNHRDHYAPDEIDDLDSAVVTQEELIQGIEERMKDERDNESVATIVTQSGYTFEYVPWWTEAMMFGISFVIGTILVGLSQVRVQALALLDSTPRQKRFSDEDDDEYNDTASHSDSDLDDEESLGEKGKLDSKLSAVHSGKSGIKTRSVVPKPIPTIVSRLLMFGSLGLNFWMVHSEYWNPPALIFVAIGSVATFLVHTWIPADL